MNAVSKVGIIAIALLAMLVSDAGAFIIAPPLTGARVTGVWAGSPAQRIGLEPGDVIVAIDGQSFRSLTEFHRLIELSGRRVTLTIRNVRTGQLVQADTFPISGRIGVNLQIISLPTLTYKDVLRAGMPGN